MSKLVVVLADTDEKYLMPLELKFIEEFGDKADIEVISDKDYFNSYFSSLKKIDILVIHETLYSSELAKHSIENLFILTETNDVNSTQNMSINKIYKYTSIKEIFNELMSNPSTKALRSFNQKEDTKVVMVYSPSGGSGKTIVSLGISAAIAKCHKHVLYINTETLQRYNFMLKNKEFCPHSFEQRMIQRNEIIIQHLPGAVGVELFDYLLPFKQSISSLNINMEHYKRLIDTIKSEGQYDYIVVDCSSDFTIEKTMMMSYCNKVMIITGQDAVSVSKLDSLLENIDCSDNNKYMFICNRYSGESENNLISNNLNNKCTISEYIEYFDLDYDDFNLEILAMNKHFQKLAYTLI
ncbi:AAA family ATPase [Clostridium sp.]|uniref:AAA family ATPase n=1 Tax=Clostridium sp. TaxID=1506 RepID=UPI00262DA7CE|nr:AAA family ATPase [uncultured Clostridium sp.]